MTPTNTTGAQALSDEQILSCMGDKQPARSSARHGAAIFEYRLFGLVDFARKVLALSSREQAGAVVFDDEDIDGLSRVLLGMERIASGVTETTDHRLFAETRPRKMTINDAKDIVAMHIPTLRKLRDKLDAAPGAAVAAREQETTEPRYGFLCYSCSHEWEASTPTADCPARECGTTNNFNVDHRPASREEAPEQSAKGLTMGGEDAK